MYQVVRPKGKEQPDSPLDCPVLFYARKAAPLLQARHGLAGVLQHPEMAGLDGAVQAAVLLPHQSAADSGKQILNVTNGKSLLFYKNTNFA